MSKRDDQEELLSIKSLATGLTAELLYRKCSAGSFKFNSTEELDDVEGLNGQKRALDAIHFGSRINKHGFNLFVLGPPGSGKHMSVSDYLEKKAAAEETPPDWVYVNNFDMSHKPVAILLPTGEGVRLRKTMSRLIDDMQAAIPAIFESDEYQARRRNIEDAFRETQEAAFNKLKERANAKNITVMKTPAGFAMAPMRNDKVIEPEIFNQLEADVRKKIEETIEGLQKELEDILQDIPRWDKDRRGQLKELNQQLAEVAVAQGMVELEREFGQLPSVADYIESVRRDLIDNVTLFIGPPKPNAPGPIQLLVPEEPSREDHFSRYEVNVLVSHADGASESKGAPVIYEDHPTMSNLVGRVELLPQLGTLVTDFNFIKSGVLHRANGGYLLLDARRLLTQPVAWEALKRSLQSHKIKIESPSEFSNLVNTVSLESDPIPLNIKVILFGDRNLYYTLCAHDPDFDDLFKVAADFDETIERNDGANQLFARLMSTLCRQSATRHLTTDGVARMIEHASRIADDAEKLSMRTGPLSDVLNEADYWAKEAERGTICAADVDRAIMEQQARLDRMRELSHEAIARDIILIDTQGEEIGQINGLSVVSLGNFAFGRPTRITANTRMGSGRVIDIEREVKLGGPLHSKGILILSGYISNNFALNVPLALRASLVFEQSYGGVDGDSASSAELYALLSAISGIPIKQCFAVTGSVNQKGEVQAIGGVNEKIEGYYDVCRERGFTGEQGVLIPTANSKNLMLRQDVVDSCEKKDFHIFPVTTINEGIEILTGIQAGARGIDGEFPRGTVNHRVEKKLIEFAKARKAFGVESIDQIGESEGSV